MVRNWFCWVNGVAATALGAYLLLLCFFRPEGLVSLPMWVSSGWCWAFAFFVGALLVGVNVAALVTERRGGTLSRTLRLTTEGGSTALSVAALEAELAAGLARQPDLSGIKVTLEPQENGLPTLCHLKFKTSSRQDLPGRVDKVKKQVRDLFLMMFPSGLGLEIHAEVTNFTGTPPAQPVEPAAPSSSSAAPVEFAGPVYPDDARDEAVDGSFPPPPPTLPPAETPEAEPAGDASHAEPEATEPEGEGEAKKDEDPLKPF